MNKKPFYVATMTAAILLGPAHAGQDRWAVGEKTLTLNGKPVFLSGVNYVPPVNWHESFLNWNPVDLDRDLAALKSMNLRCLRVFPLWPILQPRPDRLDEGILKRLDAFMDMAAKHNLFVQLSPITGWMSGFTFLPDWADRNLFTDPVQIEAERFFVSALAERYRTHPAVCSWDFGNEINVLIDFMKPEVSPDSMDRWMRTLASAFKIGDPDHPLTNGVGTGFDERFNIRAIAKSTDFMSVHSYPYFHRTIMLDPPNGQRTTYSVNYITEWAAMAGKPVLVQETGATGSKQTSDDRLRYLRVTLASSWAEGAAGYFWWCSHDVRPDYQIRIPGLRLDYSVEKQRDNRLSRFEQQLGLLGIDNQEKEIGIEYRRLIKTIDKLGQGWKDLRPVIYILTPDHDEYFRTMLDLITPFTLLKQAHADVKFLRDGSPVPNDATGVVVPGRPVSESGKTYLRKYLENGGTVYQSFYNDFADGIRLTDAEIRMESPRVWFEQRAGMLSADRFVRPSPCRVRDMTIDGGLEVLARLCSGAEKPWDWNFGKPFFVQAAIGKGRYFYLAADLETSLADIYDPWNNDPGVWFYKALMPETYIDMDNKFVELFHKTRDGETLLILINHSETFQDARVLSKFAVRLVDFESGKDIGQGTAIPVQMEPGRVLFCAVR